MQQQPLQVLDRSIASLGQQAGTQPSLSMLQQLFSLQSQANKHLDKQIDSKMDKMEFCQIVQYKTNQQDFYRLLQDLLKAPSFEDFQKNSSARDLLPSEAGSIFGEQTPQSFLLGETSARKIYPQQMMENPGKAGGLGGMKNMVSLTLQNTKTNSPFKNRDFTSKEDNSTFKSDKNQDLKDISEVYTELNTVLHEGAGAGKKSNAQILPDLQTERLLSEKMNQINQQFKSVNEEGTGEKQQMEATGLQTQQTMFIKTAQSDEQISNNAIQIVSHKGQQFPTINQSSALNIRSMSHTDTKGPKAEIIISDQLVDKKAAFEEKSTQMNRALSIAQSKCKSQSSHLSVRFAEMGKNFQNQQMAIEDRIEACEAILAENHSDAVSLVQQLNEKVDEIFNSMYGQIQQNDVEIQTKVVEMAEANLNSLKESNENHDARLKELEEQITKMVSDAKEEVQKKLDLKANRNSVAATFHKKANKADVEKQLETSAAEAKKEKLLNHKQFSELTCKFDKLDAELNQKIVSCEFGVLGSVFSKLEGELSRFFKNFALENYGPAVLQKKGADQEVTLGQDEVGLKQVLDTVVEEQLRKQRVDPQFIKREVATELEGQVMDQVMNEVDQLSFQINAVKRELKDEKARRKNDQKTLQMMNLAGDWAGDEADFDKGPQSLYSHYDSVKTQLKALLADVEAVKMAVALKANQQEVVAVVERKANFDEVFKVFAEMKKSIELLRSKQESLESSKSLSDMLADQRTINSGFSRSTGGLIAANSTSALEGQATLQRDLLPAPDQALGCQQFTVFQFAWNGETALIDHTSTMPSSGLMDLNSFAHSSSGGASLLNPFKSMKKTAVPLPQKQATAESSQLLLMKWATSAAPSQTGKNLLREILNPQVELGNTAEDTAVVLKEAGIYHLELVVFQGEEESTARLASWKRFCREMRVQILLDLQPVLTSVGDKKASANQLLVYHDEKQRQIGVSSYVRVEKRQSLSVSLVGLEASALGDLRGATQGVLNLKKID